MAADSRSETDALEDIELDTLMSLLGDGGMFPDDDGRGLSINDSGTSLESLDDAMVDDMMEFHDCFDNFPNDFDDFAKFSDDTSVMEPASAPDTIVPVADTVVPTSVPVPTNVPSTSMPVPTNVPGTIVPPGIDLGLVVQSTNQLLLNAILSRSIDLSQLSCPNMAETVPKDPHVEMHNLQQCVQHDHTYLGASAGGSGGVRSEGVKEGDAAGEKSASDTEEGSSSDTGYDTMSTSPGGSSTSTDQPSPSLSFAQLPSDPVKLIDERIKFYMSRQQKVQLTMEEKETLRAEGLPIPTTLPLTKTEERALKNVRRKIRNKVAAQESRKKKKEYIDQLEGRVKYCTSENLKLKKKVDSLETENKTLMQQLSQLQALVARTNPVLGRPFHLGTGLMVIVLCFGILFGNLIPYKVSITATDYTTVSAVRSRALLSVPDQHHNSLMGYFESLFLGHNRMTTPSDSAHIDDERYVHWMVDFGNLTSSYSPVVMA